MLTLDSFDVALVDIGNVLLAFDYSPVIEMLGNCDWDKFVAVRDEFECGQLTTEEFFEKMLDFTGYTGSRVEFEKAWQGIFIPILPMWELCAALKNKGKKLVTFSNINALHVADFERYSVFKLFDEFIYSFEVGEMKPKAGMYEDAINRVGVIPERTIYFDDVEQNLDMGKWYGFQTIQIFPGRWEEQIADIKAAWNLQ